MRYIQRVVVLLMAVLLTFGCDILEDRGDCPDTPSKHELILHFSNIDKEGSDIFGSTVSKVDIFLFDQEDRLIEQFEAPAEELKKNQSATLNIEPGIYRIVCWGNAHENSFYDTELGRVVHENHIDRGAELIEGDIKGDPRYYAPFDTLTPQRFEVLPRVVNEVDVRMRAAHVKMQFKVIGYKESTGKSDNPYIEVSNLYPRYNFLLRQPQERSVDYIVQTVDEQNRTRGTTKDVSYAKLNTPRFGSKNPIMINLRASPTSEPLYSFDLEKELADSGIEVELELELTLYFEIVFNGSDISVSIEAWSANELNPDLPS